MALEKGKHSVEEINGVRCTVIEKGATEERMKFLRDLLEFNQFEVHVAEEKSEIAEAIITYTIGVSDLTFNPVIAVYQMRLKTRDGQKVSPAYYRQLTANIDNRYWRYRHKPAPGPRSAEEDFGLF